MGKINSKKDLILHNRMIVERKIFLEHLKAMGVVMSQPPSTKLEISENGGYLFKIFATGNSYDKMCEFHEEKNGRILLIFNGFAIASGKYQPTGEVMSFENFEGLHSSIISIFQKLK